MLLSIQQGAEIAQDNLEEVISEEKTLSIYVIHFILLYGSFTGYGLKKFLSNSLEPTTAILAAVLFMVVVCFISFHYAKTNAFVYNLTRKMIDTFKNR